MSERDIKHGVVTRTAPDGTKQDVPFLCVPVAKADWHAMVERAARRHFEESGLAIDSLGGRWGTWEECDDGARTAFMRSAGASLRVALAFPPDWEPTPTLAGST